MSAAACDILTAFDALPNSDRDAVLEALLLRRPLGEGDLPDAAFTELAEELFLTYDAAEAADAASPINRGDVWLADLGMAAKVDLASC